MWTDDFLTFDDVKLHYVRTGGAKPPLVLLHGFTDSVLEWARFARTLETDYDVIMLDTRGHGQSSAPPRDFTLEEQAHDVAKLITHLGIERTSVLGHSMGAATAIQLSALHPDLVVCAVLEDPPLLPLDAPRGDRSEWKAWLVEFKALSPEERLEQAYAGNDRWEREEIPPWAASKALFAIETFDTDLMILPDWRPAARVIRAPSLLITGENEQGAIITPEGAREAASIWLGELHIQRIAGAGHNVRRDQPAAYFEIVAPFLKAHAQG